MPSNVRAAVVKWTYTQVKPHCQFHCQCHVCSQFLWILCFFFILIELLVVTMYGHTLSRSARHAKRQRIDTSAHVRVYGTYHQSSLNDYVIWLGSAYSFDETFVSLNICITHIRREHTYIRCNDAIERLRCIKITAIRVHRVAARCDAMDSHPITCKSSERTV